MAAAAMALTSSAGMRATQQYQPSASARYQNGSGYGGHHGGQSRDRISGYHHHQQASSHHQNSVHLTPSEVTAAVASLYDDQLKPFGRILRKRVAERAAASGQHKSVALAAGAVPPAPPVAEQGGATAEGDSLPNVDMKQLRSVCNRCRDLRLEEEEGGDWSVVLANRAPNFVDVYDSADTYPEELWENIAEYFASIAGTQLQFLPGGRYSCAQTLVGRNLAFLNELSLGQVCHVVQLAISHKRILGYLNGAVVPYTCSQSMMKEQRAEWQLPYVKPTCTTPGEPGQETLPFASIQDAKRCLQLILETEAKPSYTWGGGRNNGTNYTAVPLSNIKRLFRSRFHLELSETMLGYSKLSELLQDVDFHDVCDVKLIGHGYIVLPKPGASQYEKRFEHRGEWQRNQGSGPALPPGINQAALGAQNGGRALTLVDYIDELQGHQPHQQPQQQLYQSRPALPTLLAASSDPMLHESPSKIGMAATFRVAESQKMGAVPHATPASIAELESMNYIQQQHALFRQHQQRLQQETAQYEQQQLQLQQQHQRARTHSNPLPVAPLQPPPPGDSQQPAGFSVPNWTPSPVRPGSCDAAALHLIDAPARSSVSGCMQPSPTVFRVQDAFVGENRCVVEPGVHGLPR